MQKKTVSEVEAQHQNEAPAGVQRQWVGMSAPRYTSYPTAPHFSPAVTPETYVAWLAGLTEKTPASVYVHIPFCEQLCWFCGCTTRITQKYEPVARYLETLHDEIALVQKHVGGRLNVEHLHFGGGSPTILSAGDFSRLYDGLKQAFHISPSAEIAVEIDPRTLTREKVSVYAKAGVTRASIGVQDFNPRVQKAIHREQPFALVKEVFGWLRSEGVDAINADLVYGLPHQSEQGMRQSVEALLRLDPSRIALFSYAHVPWMKKHQRLIDESVLPTDDQKLAIYLSVKHQLESAGYVMIGIDHFALPADTLAQTFFSQRLSRNFQGYTADAAEALIGLGLSSISQLPQGYVQNSSNAHHYRKNIEARRFATERGFALGGDDLLRREVIMTLMCYLAADVGEIAARHGKTADYFREELSRLAPLEAAGVVTRQGALLKIAGEYRMAVRSVCAAFDRYLSPEAQRYSKVA